MGNNQELQESGGEKLFRLLECMPDAVVFCRDGKIAFLNPSALRLIGAASSSDLIGRPLTSILPDFYCVPDAKSPPIFVEQSLLCLDGRKLDVEVALLPAILENDLERVVFIHDISAFKQAQTMREAAYLVAQAAYRVERLEQLYAAIHEIIRTVMPAENFYIALYDEDTQTISFPYTVDEVDQDYPDVMPLGKGLTEYVIRTAAPLFCDEATKQALFDSGEVEPIGTPSLLWLGVPLIVDGKSIGVMAVQHYRDPGAYTRQDLRMLEFVSHQVAMAIKRKQTLDALQQSEESFRTLFEHVLDGIYRSLPDGRLLAINPALANMLGYKSASDLVGMRWQDFYVEPQAYQSMVDLLKQQGSVRNYEIVLRCVDGRQITCIDNALAVYGHDEELLYFEGVITDVSEQKRVEQALWQRIHILQSLAEIDRTILRTDQPDEIARLVCSSVAALLNAPKALLLSLQDGQIKIDASYGTMDLDALLREAEPLKESFFQEGFDAVAFGSLKKAPVFMPKFSKREKVTAMVIAPFLIETSKTHGVLAVFDTREREWGEEQTELVRLLAGQAAIGLEKASLFRDVQRRATEFSVLYDIALDLTDQHDIDTLLTTILEHAKRLLNAPSSSLFLYDPSTDELELRLFSGADIQPGLRMKMGEGMAGQVALTRRPMILDDYSGWEYRSPLWEKVPFAAALQVPMLYSGELIGVLAVSMLGESTRKFNENDARLLYLFAGQAAGAIYNARLFVETRRTNKELERLYRATGALIASVSSDLTALAQTIVNTIVSDFKHSNCALWLLDEETKELKRLALAGSFSGQMCLNELYLYGSGIIPRTVRTGIVSNVPNVLFDPDYKIGWLDARSELCIPLEVNGRIIGAIDLQSAQEAAFNATDERLMVMFATRAALMVEHVRVLEQTERRLQRLTVLRTIETAIASSLELGVTLNVLLEQITSQLKVDAAAVFLLEPNLQILEYAAGRGFLGSGITRARLRIGEDLVGRAVLERVVVGVADISEVTPFPEYLTGEGFVTYYVAPLIAKGKVRGVLELYYRRRFIPDPEWPDFLETLARQAAVAIEDASMFAELQKSYTDLMVAYDASIEVWSRALDLRERDAPGHAQRLTDLSLRLAREMGVDDSILPHIYRGALLHDIGQLSIPDSILLKPGPLTEQEWKIIREHPSRAYDMLFPVVYLHPALKIPYCHHEHWDGSGYPQGLKGEEIPLEARIFAVVDAWDALCSTRPYRTAWSQQDALRYIRDQAGKKFDPAVVDAFLRLIQQEREG